MDYPETIIDNIKVGDWIGFKCDIEQSAEVVEIKKDDQNGRKLFVVKAPSDGFSGNYIGRDDFHTVYAEEVF